MQAGLVAVEDLLNQPLRLGRHRAAAFGEHEVHPRPADDLAHRTLRRLAQCDFRLAVLEEESCGILHPILHRELEVDDVLVLGQHERLAGNRGGAAALVPESDLRVADPVHIDRDHRIDEVRRPVEPWIHDAMVCAKAQHHALLRLLDDPYAREPPRYDQHGGNESGSHKPSFTEPATGPTTTGSSATGGAPTEDPSPLGLQLSEYFVEIRRSLLPAAIPPWVAVSVSVGLIPSHPATPVSPFGRSATPRHHGRGGEKVKRGS